MTRWAIDANIFMQQATRRLVCGTIEYRRDELLIPERALLLARLVYDDLALKRAQRITEHDERHGITPGTGAYNALVARRASAILENFAAWTETEPPRNDGAWQVASDTQAAKQTAQALRLARVARRGTWTPIEEDAHVAAQALANGCRYIASHNLARLDDETFRLWLAEQQAQGALLGAANPFVVGVDQALNQLLDIERTDGQGHERVTALAWELTRPDHQAAARNIQARLATVQRFAAALHNGGAARTADAIRQVLHLAKDHPERMNALTATHNLYGRVERTRAAERRLVAGERHALANVAVPSTPPLAGYARGDDGLSR